MRPIILLMVLVCFLPDPLSVQAQPETPPDPTMGLPFDDIDPAIVQAEMTGQITRFLDILQAHWGQNQEGLRSHVAGQLERQEPDVLVFSRSLADHGILEGYDFRDGSLVRGRYVCVQRPVNGLNEFIDYYTVVKRALTDTYGIPAQDRIIWDNDLYQPLPDYWGIAVQMGHLHYATSWHTPQGILTLELTGHHHSRLTLEYRSRRDVEGERTALRRLPRTGPSS